jgi:hypothetical protein
VLKSFCCSSVATGDLGPSWSSAMGGGLGSRGELEGDTADAAMLSDVSGTRFGVSLTGASADAGAACGCALMLQPFPDITLAPIGKAFCHSTKFILDEHPH